MCAQALAPRPSRVLNPSDEVLVLTVRKVLEANKPEAVACYEVAANMNRLGLFLIALGLGAAALSLTYAFKANPLINVTVIAGSVSAILIAMSCGLCNKTYLKDPQFRWEKVTTYLQNVRERGYQQADFHGDSARKLGLITDAEVAAFVRLTDFLMIHDNRLALVRDAIFTNAEMVRIYHHEIKIWKFNDIWKILNLDVDFLETILNSHPRLIEHFARELQDEWAAELANNRDLKKQDYITNKYSPRVYNYFFNRNG